MALLAGFVGGGAAVLLASAPAGAAPCPPCGLTDFTGTNPGAVVAGPFMFSFAGGTVTEAVAVMPPTGTLTFYYQLSSPLPAIDLLTANFSGSATDVGLRADAPAPGFSPGMGIVPVVAGRSGGTIEWLGVGQGSGGITATPDILQINTDAVYPNFDLKGTVQIDQEGGFPILGQVSGYEPAAAPVITTNPLSQNVGSGGTATFTVGASGLPTPTLDWQLSIDGGTSWLDLGPLTGTTFTSSALNAFENGWQIRAKFTNGSGSVTTSAATVTVLNNPTVTLDPLSQSVASGGTLTFTVGGAGTPTPTLNWQVSFDGGVTWMSLGPLTGDTVTSSPLYAFENGWKVRAVFTNTAGSAATPAATITVT
jgi:hypothetical protein